MATNSTSQTESAPHDHNGCEKCARVNTTKTTLLAAAEAVLADVESYGLLHPELGGRFEPESAELLRAAVQVARGGAE